MAVSLALDGQLWMVTKNWRFQLSAVTPRRGNLMRIISRQAEYLSWSYLCLRRGIRESDGIGKTTCTSMKRSVNTPALIMTLNRRIILFLPAPGL